MHPLSMGAVHVSCPFGAAVWAWGAVCASASKALTWPWLGSFRLPAIIAPMRPKVNHLRRAGSS
jgi:hypothetical protein